MMNDEFTCSCLLMSNLVQQLLFFSLWNYVNCFILHIALGIRKTIELHPVQGMKPMKK